MRPRPSRRPPSGVRSARGAYRRRRESLTPDGSNLAERERRAGADPADIDVVADVAKEHDALAEARDVAAEAREAAALTRRDRAAGRDVAASLRDRRHRDVHDDADPGFPDRFLSGRDVDASAGDRADALGDERHARQDRQRGREDREHAADDRTRAAEAADRADIQTTTLRAAMEARTVIGQAQGLLMARSAIGADEAFSLLVRVSQRRNIKVSQVARSLVDHTEQGLPFDTDSGRWL